MGNPIAHSKSPQIHRAFAEQTSQNIFYQKILVDEGGFTQAIDDFQEQGGLGLNITVPLKGEAWHAVDIRSVRAEKAQSVNTIWFSDDGQRHGDTTDGIGLVRDLQNNEVQIKDKRLLILGAGGAVRGVIAPLFDEKPEAITLVNRTHERALELVRQFSEHTHFNAVPLAQLTGQSFDIVINGTAASLNDQLLTLPDDTLKKNTCCYDMVYGNSDTVFVQWGKRIGAAKSLDGLGMLVEQAAESFYLWRGVRPETKKVIEMLRKA